MICYMTSPLLSCSLFFQFTKAICLSTSVRSTFTSGASHLKRHLSVSVKIIGLVSGMNTLDWLRCSEHNIEAEFNTQCTLFQRLQSTPYIYSSVIAHSAIPTVTPTVTPIISVSP
jgi:hypothetical protein